MLFLQDELDEKKTYYVEVKILQSYDPGRSLISKLHCYSYLVYDTLIPYTSIQHFQNLSLLLLERFISKHQLDDLHIEYVFNKLKVFWFRKLFPCETFFLNNRLNIEVQKTYRLAWKQRRKEEEKDAWKTDGFEHHKGLARNNYEGKLSEWHQSCCTKSTSSDIQNTFWNGMHVNLVDSS